MSLLLSHRGTGGSEIPWSFPSMKDLATDTLEVLDYLGWKEDRSVHIVGHSMGGMIAQELVNVIRSSFPRSPEVESNHRLYSHPPGLHP